MILLDTHVVVWLSSAPEKISKTGLNSINSARTEGLGLSIADITLFELALLISRKRIGIKVSVESFLHEVEARFKVLPINRQVAEVSMQFPKSYPKDPIDRLIGATALVHGLTLVTADNQIRKSKLISTIW